MLRLRQTHSIWNFLIVVTGVIGFLLLIINWIPYQATKAWFDVLAPDGSLESFTPAIFTAFKRILFPFGLISLLVALLLYRTRHEANQILSTIIVSQNLFVASRSAEIRHLTNTLRGALADSRYLVALLVIVGLGAVNRAVLLSRQVSHDEAYTFMAFVSMGLRQVLTDYHLPNNHVFHSILVFISSEIFGIQPWAIRLPAFVAGVLIIPATYLVARSFYDQKTALISAGWVASIPALISYAASARGYSIVTLFGLILVALGAYLKDKKNLVGWIAFVLLAALGFYTVPIMLYPFGLVMTWMFLAALFKQVGPDYKDGPTHRLVIHSMVSASLAVIGLVILLYMPIFINSGFKSVVGNGFVAPMEWWEFRESIPVRMTNTWREWIAGLPPILSTILIIGLTGSVLSSLSRKPPRVLLAGAAFLWISTVLVIQRVAPWPRVWIFLLPLVLIASAAGLMAISRFLESRLPYGRSLSGIIFGSLLLLPLVMSGIRTLNISGLSRSERGNIEELAIFFKDSIGPHDVVLVSAPDAVTLRYYLKQYGIEGDQVFFRDHEEYRNAFVVVNRRYDQTLDSVLYNRSFTAEIDARSATVVYERGRILVYRINLQASTRE